MVLLDLGKPDIRPLVIQAREVPILRGETGAGVDLHCPSCRNVVAEDVSEEGVLDLGIQCFSCGTVGKTSSLAPGAGIGGCVLPIPVGVHRAESTVVLRCDEIVVGQPGLDRRQKETTGTETLHRITLDIAGCRGIVERTRSVYGRILAPLEARNRRSAEHRGANPARRHRLPELIRTVEENISALEGGSQEVDVITVLELHSATAAFERWRNDPSWARLLHQCKEPTAFAHNVVLLTMAGAFADGGLGAELVPEASESTPDLRLRVSARRWIEVEVKAPVPLQRRANVTLPTREAEAILRDALRTSSSQFTEGQSAILVIGGSFWTADVDSHAAAALETLTERSRPRLAGVILVSNTILVHRARGSGQLRERWEEVDWVPSAQFRWIANPTYTHELKIEFTPDLGSYELSFPP